MRSFLTFACFPMALLLLHLSAFSLGCTPSPTGETASEPTVQDVSSEKTIQPDETSSSEPAKEPTRDTQDGGEPVKDNTPEPAPDKQTNEVNDAGEPNTPDEPVRENPPLEVPPEPSKTACARDWVETFGKDRVTIRCSALSTRVSGVALRSYVMKTTHTLRDNLPPSKEIRFSEDKDMPFVRTGSVLIDALFAMAIHETKLNSVSHVKEFAFFNGKPVLCPCFQTGEKWTWAWTRDTAYAVDLGLAWIDPKRSRDTLLFKLSHLKTGGSPQIVQDTGTGGSWPVSSDRVVWALAARRLLPMLNPQERKDFLKKAWPALKNTVEHDRKTIFDTKDGLYRGEQSFLDWREQSYPRWVPSDLSLIAQSKALSTNLNHLSALDTAAVMAKEQGLAQEEAKYRQWADALRKAIHKELYSSSSGWYKTLKLSLGGGIAVDKTDLLGNSLAILEGVSDGSQSQRLSEVYPHSPAGAPVLWPQQPLTRIYHNRAIWPFVSAYWLLAAQQAGNQATVAHNWKSLVQAAALNLSHMENLEWMTGKNYVQDGQYSGPVVNSRRQLWSVAGFVGIVLRGLFGVDTTLKGTRLKPFVPVSIARSWFPQGKLALYNWNWQGKRLQIHLKLPTATNNAGAFVLDTLSLNGKSVSVETLLKPDTLLSGNRMDCQLKETSTSSKVRIVRDSSNFRLFWSPREPAIKKIEKVTGGLRLTLSSEGEQTVRFAIYRDGKKLGQTTGTSWTDTNANTPGKTSYCYNLVSQFTDSLHVSHPSKTLCWKGVNDGREQWLYAWSFQTKGGKWTWQGKELWLSDWGADKDSITIRQFRPNWTGSYRLTALFQNTNGPLSTGISSAFKRVRIWEEGSTQLLHTGFWVMPHSQKGQTARSTSFEVRLDAGKHYRMVIDEPDFPANMSYFSHFTNYNGGAGGGATVFNKVSLHSIHLLAVQGDNKTPKTGSLVKFDGNNDLNKLPKTQILTPGIPLETWERFGLTWDEDWLYVTIVSKAFEQPLKAFFLYIQSATTTLPAASSSRGMTYLNQQSHLPFTPTHVLGVRERTDNNDGFGPWNGVWKKGSNAWELQHRLKPGRGYFVAGDKHTIAFKISRSLLGFPTKIRLLGHIVNAQSGNEWKVTLPKNHTPWTSSSKGYVEIDLKKAKASTNWVQK